MLEARDAQLPGAHTWLVSAWSSIPYLFTLFIFQISALLR